MSDRKERVRVVGIDRSGYSGRGLRADWHQRDTSRAPSWKIRQQQTGHGSDVMLARYIRDGNLFLDNAAGALLYESVQ